MNARSHTHVTAALRLCLHALLTGLLGLVVVRAVSEDAQRAPAVVVVAGLMAALYAAGPLAASVQPGSRAGAGWLAGLGALWAALLVLSPDALWVAFPLYFLQLHILPMRWALPAVVVTAGAAITSFVVHEREIE
ncbi:sensor histidine kinase, partial [Streptomyces sp. SID7499]|nr:sensor histidine kinase [Streptomyces sp. SID7499]